MANPAPEVEGQSVGQQQPDLRWIKPDTWNIVTDGYHVADISPEGKISGHRTIFDRVRPALEKLQTPAKVVARTALGLGVLAGAQHVAPPVASADNTPPHFILGFETIDNQIPAQVGQPLENQSFAANGDAQQHTTGGLLAWRKADNWTAFTDGYHTWVNGPYGLQERLNTERFPYEHDTAAPANAGGASPAELAPLTDPARERAGKNLQELLNAQDPNVYPFTNNPFGLDATEVSTFQNTGQDTFSTFRVRDGLIIATSQKGPLPEMQGVKFNVPVIEAALQLGKSIDPSFPDMLAGNGLKVVAGSAGLFRARPGVYDASGDGRFGLIAINELEAGARSTDQMLGILLAESFLIDDLNNGPVIDTNVGIDKTLRAINWVNGHKDKMTAQQFNDLSGQLQNSLNGYRNNPALAPIKPLRS